MKAVFVYVLLAMSLACAFAADTDCDPNGDGKPDCDASQTGKVYRNFWDPTHYWECPSGGGDAVLQQCKEETLFESRNGVCIPWNEWTWVDPCPVSSA